MIVAAVKVTGVCHSSHQQQSAVKVAEGGGLLGEVDGMPEVGGGGGGVSNVNIQMLEEFELSRGSRCSRRERERGTVEGKTREQTQPFIIEEQENRKIHVQYPIICTEHYV